MRRPASTLVPFLVVLLASACGTTASSGGSVSGGSVRASDAAPSPGSEHPSVPPSTDATSRGATAQARDLAAARDRWAAAHLSDYDLTVGRSCFCTVAGVVHVTVRSGRPVGTPVLSSEYPNASSAVPPDTPLTVEALFDRVRSDLEKAAAVTVRYDAATGFPEYVMTDWIGNAIDDEQTFEVSLRPVAG